MKFRECVEGEIYNIYPKIDKYKFCSVCKLNTYSFVKPE